MIVFQRGDLLASNAEAIVNTVNCVGVMGRGIALQFKKKYPENFTCYEAACKRGEVVPGKTLTYEMASLLKPRYIINFPSKRHWRGASKLEDIASGLTDLVKTVRELKISSIAVPPIGCGLGGLDWNQVKPLMERAFEQLPDVTISIYEPVGAPLAEEMVQNRKVPKMTNGRAALISLVKRYLAGLLDPDVTLLEIHKLMYFLQESGEPLKLNYVKAHYGPYAKNLMHVMNAVEGHFLSGYADGGDNPNKQIHIVPGADADAQSFLDGHTETMQRIERVAELADGFESSFGLELLATVHWVARDNVTSLDDVISGVYQWGEQKRKFSPKQIEVAYERLNAFGWLDKSVS